MSSPSLIKFGKRTPANRQEKVPIPPKIGQRKCTKSSITQPRIIRFRSNFVQSLNISHPKCCKSSRSRDQMSRSQRDMTVNLWRTKPQHRYTIPDTSVPIDFSLFRNEGGSKTHVVENRGQISHF